MAIAMSEAGKSRDSGGVERAAEALCMAAKDIGNRSAKVPTVSLRGLQAALAREGDGSVFDVYASMLVNGAHNIDDKWCRVFTKDLRLMQAALGKAYDALPEPVAMSDNLDPTAKALRGHPAPRGPIGKVNGPYKIVERDCPTCGGIGERSSGNTCVTCVGSGKLRTSVPAKDEGGVTWKTLPKPVHVSKPLQSVALRPEEVASVYRPRTQKELASSFGKDDSSQGDALVKMAEMYKQRGDFQMAASAYEFAALEFRKEGRERDANLAKANQAGNRRMHRMMKDALPLPVSVGDAASECEGCGKKISSNNFLCAQCRKKDSDRRAQIHADKIVERTGGKDTSEWDWTEYKVKVPIRYRGVGERQEHTAKVTAIVTFQPDGKVGGVTWPHMSDVARELGLRSNQIGEITWPHLSDLNIKKPARDAFPLPVPVKDSYYSAHSETEIDKALLDVLERKATEYRAKSKRGTPGDQGIWASRLDDIERQIASLKRGGRIGDFQPLGGLKCQKCGKSVSEKTRQLGGPPLCALHRAIASGAGKDDFKSVERSVAKEPGVKDPAAVAAAIGRKKLGNAEMARRSAAGRAKDAALRYKPTDCIYNPPS